MIILIPGIAVDKEIIDILAKPVTDAFHQQVGVRQPFQPESRSWDTKRQQYRADAILDVMPVPLPENRVLLILDADIYAFGLNFIFGEADANTKKALISLTRLRPEYYQLPPDKAIFEDRIITEAVHELGHTYSLKHCPDIHCVMHFSVTIQDTDWKGWMFCSICKQRLDLLIKAGTPP
jgi:archaemetzincin